MTARVIVNRLWQYHFGQGIVATPNDFGVAGESPTHPELLDWLAVEFIDSGWSLKEIQRLMVTSATYRQSAIVDPKNEMHAKALAADSGNKLLWHARRQRLTGEALRDAVLFMSGDLGSADVWPERPSGIARGFEQSCVEGRFEGRGPRPPIDLCRSRSATCDCRCLMLSICPTCTTVALAAARRRPRRRRC